MGFNTLLSDSDSASNKFKIEILLDRLPIEESESWNSIGKDGSG
jgi:hypothetical protein